MGVFCVGRPSRDSPQGHAPSGLAHDPISRVAESKNHSQKGGSGAGSADSSANWASNESA
jgi:hypothetical protein